MAEKKNDILEEQRRSREEFLKLKKMQQGEIKTPPKPSEEAVLPKTPKEKAANYWFHYKWHTIATVLVVIVMSVLIVQCTSRVKYDMKVVFFTYDAVIDQQTNAIADYFENCMEDINGDGEVNIQVLNCSFSNDSRDVQYKTTVLTKLQATIAADENALLFITDADSMEYFGNISGGTSIFEEEPKPFKQEFYEAIKIGELDNINKNLQISCRRVSGTLLENKKGVADIYKQSQRIIDAVTE